MALPDLLSAIESEADAEAAALVRDAEGEARRLLDAARAEAAEAEQAPLRAQEATLRAEAAQRVAAARAGAAARRRAAREDAFSEALARLGERLAAARDDERWPDRLATLVDEALAALPAEAVATVHADRRDAPLVEGHLTVRGLGRLPVAADVTTHGGVLVTTSDGRRADNTLEARVATAEAQLRRRFAAIMEEGRT